MKKVISLLSLVLCPLSLLAAPPRRVFIDSAAIFRQAEQEAMALAGEAPIRHAVADVGVKKIFPRIPVIMVQFSDFTFTRTKAQVDTMFNGVNYNTAYSHATAKGSVRQYFHDQSDGQYNPQFDIYGPITLNSSCCNSFANYDNVRTMVKTACTLANDSIDFSQYDADNDGQIDLVYIYYAGFGRSDVDYIADGLVTNKNQLIWPHWSTTSGATYDGKSIRDYECANELDGYWTKNLTNPYPAGMGVAVHEFCHALGLPDLYPTNKTTIKNMGAYDVMDYGCYNDEMFCPSSLSAYER